jgi:hypothetical protein
LTRLEWLAVYLLDEIKENGGYISGHVIGADLKGEIIRISPW